MLSGAIQDWDESEQEAPEQTVCLTWQVHLARRDPGRLPMLLLILGCAGVCVWFLFRAFPPALAAVLLLVGATRDYLFPVTYRIDAEGVFADAPASRLVLTWKETRRAVLERNHLILTPLERPSRLDAFRGILLRFAPDGEPGDRASVLAAVRHYAPNLTPNPSPTRRGEQNG
jgi:hypothetical protein